MSPNVKNSQHNISKIFWHFESTLQSLISGMGTGKASYQQKTSRALVLTGGDDH